MAPIFAVIERLAANTSAMAVYFFHSPTATISQAWHAPRARLPCETVSHGNSARTGSTNCTCRALPKAKGVAGHHQSATGVEFVVSAIPSTRPRISDVARHGGIWASKSLIGKMSLKERERLSYGVRRRAPDGRELFVESSFSIVSSLLEQDGVRLEKLRDIATLAITEIVAIKPA
jgi:hypothetical protein